MDNNIVEEDKIKNKLSEIYKTITEIYSTKNELNTEAIMRATGDEKLINVFEALRMSQNQKIDDLESKIINSEDILNSISNIDGCFKGRVKCLEKENEELTNKLIDANKFLLEKINELEKLQEDVYKNNSSSIDIYFETPIEFQVYQIISVKEFINIYLKDLIITRMEEKYQDTVWIKDYLVMIEGLDYHNLMQGKDLNVIVKANQDSRLTGESIFPIKINYNYDLKQQEEFIKKLLEPTIPISLRNVLESASPDYHVPDEIVKTQPLKILLNNKDIEHLSFKIFAEINAASYWTDFHRPWQFSRNGYYGTGQSTIGGSKIINSINDLFNHDIGYYDQIFKILEKRINDSGVPCKIVKKLAKNSRSSDLLHSLGNLVFNVLETNLENDEVTVSQSQYYYIMINFELIFNDELKKLYRGVTLALTDGLELYV